MKKFLMIWSGELISSIGSGMTAFALSVYVYQTNGSYAVEYAESNGINFNEIIKLYEKI